MNIHTVQKYSEKGSVNLFSLYKNYIRKMEFPPNLNWIQSPMGIEV